MSGITGSCSETYTSSQSQLLIERGFQQHQAQRLEEARDNPATTANAQPRVPEANKGENIDIYV
jgi:hypothetical protein